MKILKDILYNVNLTSVSGNMNIEIADVCFDSRAVKAGSLFVAVKGTQVDGHEYIERAIANGAVAVVCQEMPLLPDRSVTFVETAETHRALGFIASNFYGNPSKKLKLVGVTGTNGKTTTVTLLFRLFRSLGHNVGLLSTVKNQINDRTIKASHTTPDQVSLNRLLKEMVDEGCEYAFMEVSSHAIDQGRIAGLEFAGAVFMNISHDHLDYHLTFDNYIQTKKKLFDSLPATAFALVNLDDKRGQIMTQNTKATQYAFGLKFMTDYKAKIITNSYQGLELDINGQSVWFRLIGKFNAYNLLAVFAVADLLGEEQSEVLMMLSGIETAPGRFEAVNTDSSVRAIVDYAHTPDALENVLQTIDSFRTGNEKVITVVGCGGDRDREKRPVMASIAAKWSDKVIFTDDNPRNENPDMIIKEMMGGIGPTFVKKTLIIRDRREAIKTACSLASDHDIILVAGKGHETYQEIKGVRHDFDDRAILREMLELFKD
ncbi:UDP-N-acetylmuramoyl-L-alanyl-D-glutamate--2,6-diaminopimelate ligase [Reichenbachiella agarivorans]|uniref:UDP-N-acetylmuramoyl-L-alanyl-D-glutamate--2,6-diaminopimelate ligase n=1 Tax=Reichenbachiella agarivorans TaxID=2979464 RepID=A0ABY6CJP1_9BACT|nr:UDP-N-acetylmuramoyl-L-alanyl-D-glutamate--2,6-diaminopimelate ligase [Reichenbachiella agarivorans]UXP30740.1 UDP-N-acetylmuramoyl-L-alanyl-D-glutamate--2,6-diaminopimelate ligase [Reichenbachiella agarivorans]